MSFLARRRARAGLVASLVALGLPLAASSATSAPGPEIDRAQSVNYLRSSDGGGDFRPQSLDNVGMGVGQVTQVEADQGTVHALFSTENDDDDFVFPFELYHRRSTNGGRDFDGGRRLDDGEGVSSEPSVATTGEDVHVAFEEGRLEFGLDTNGDGIDEDDEFPEEIFYTRSTDAGWTFSEPVNLSDTKFAQETDNDSAAVGGRVAVVYESDQIDLEDFEDLDEPPVIPDEQKTTERDVSIRVSDSRGRNFADPINLTFDGTAEGPFSGDDTTTQGQDQPKVGLSGDGDDDVVLVVFRIRSDEDDTARVGFVRSDDGGETFGSIEVLPADDDVDDLPALYMDGNDAHVLACDVTNRLLNWISEDGGASFDGPTVIHTGVERCQKPAIDGNGDDLHAAFREEVAGEWDIFHTRSGDGGKDWSAARNLTANHGQGEFPSIAVDTDDADDVHLIWQDESDFLFSVKFGDRLPTADGDEEHFANEDVIRYHGATYEKIFNGSRVGLRRLRIDAMAVLEPGDNGLDRFLLSFTEKGRVPGIPGWVDDSDIVLFTPTKLGKDTAGTFELFFDGSKIGLTGSGEDINAIEVLDGDLYLSTYGSFKLSKDYGKLRGKNEDVFVCRDFSTTSCGDGVEIVFDGSDRGLSKSGQRDSRGRWRSGEKLDAFAFDPDDGNEPDSRAFFSTSGDFDTGTATGEDRDIFSCVFPEFDDDLDPEPTPTNFDGDVTDCGGPASPFATTFIGEINRLKGDIMSLDVQFPV